MITRTVYREDHEMFRTTVRRFVERECLPRRARVGARCVDRDTWLKARDARGYCAPRCRRNTAAVAATSAIAPC